MGSVWAKLDCDSPAVQQSAMAINDFTIDFVIKALSDTGSIYRSAFCATAKDRGMLCSCFQSLGPKLRSIPGERSQNEHKSDATRGPTPVWNYKGFLPLQRHQMLVFTVIKQHMRGDVQEASGTVATTLLSQDRAVQSL